MSNNYYTIKPDGVVLHLHIQPKASRTKIIGLYGERLKIAIQAPPVDGKANSELINFLSKTFKINKTQIDLIGGDLSRQKEVIIFHQNPENIIKNIDAEIIK